MTQTLLLHGFTGAPESWREVCAALGDEHELFIPCLPGHTGQTFHGAASAAAERWGSRRQAGSGTSRLPALPATPDPLQLTWGTDPGFEAQLQQIAAQVESAGFGQGIIAGYSLGARLALGLALLFPERFIRCLLIGVHPGLQTEAEREQRRQQDAALQAQLLTQPYAEFLSDWQGSPLFSTQAELAPETLQRQLQIRQQQQPAGLASCLQRLGLGQMPDFRPRLATHRRPVALLVGARDAKFCALAQQLCRLSAHAQLQITPGAGHNLLLEAPGSVAEALQHSQHLQEPHG